MEECIVQINIDNYKPVMKLLPSIQAIKVIPYLTVVQVKVDGEFTLLRYQRNGNTYTVNRFGHLRMDFPALNEFKTAMDKTATEKAELLCELYAVEDGKPLKLPSFIHYIKSKDEKLIGKIHIGIWDLLKIDGKTVNQPREWRYQEVASWLKGCQLVSVLPYIKPKIIFEIENFWKLYVETRGYEGIVIRQNGETYKLKPRGELDAVIIGLNKKSSYGKQNLFSQQQITTLHLALMTPEGNFVEIGDVASGIDHQLRKALWKLMDYKISETDKIVYIQPKVIVEVEYTELFHSQNKIYKLTPQGYQHIGNMQLIRMRHPRLTRFRPDKQVNPQDLRLTQIPQKYLEAKP